jgi:hypothetical protein
VRRRTKMPRAILYVETRPASPEEAADYHKWYNEVHIPEILAIDGFVSARRFEPMDPDGPFVAIYEIDADDVEAARARLTEATQSGRNSRPVGVSFDPPPTTQYYREIASFTQA